MERRTYEGPMEWEYQNSAPVDPTSPFAQAASSGMRSGFSSPSKPETRTNSFPTLKPATTFAAPPPQSSIFQPKLNSRPTAPPFLNPAFTTPRKPYDDVGFSEASGPEDSPALTDTSDFPNDTPELDRFADVNIGSNMASSKVDKSFRYGKAALSPKKYAAGRGEIRSSRAMMLADPIRKRKRHLYDKDVGSAILHQQATYDSDTDADVQGAMRSQTRSTKHKSTQGSSVGSFLRAIDKYDRAPDNMMKWLRVGFVCASTLIISYVLWSFWTAVQSDLQNANEAARQELLRISAECRDHYTLNKCSKGDIPAMKQQCDEWFECSMQNPDAVMKVKVTAVQLAGVVNEFVEALSLKSAGFILLVLLGLGMVAFATFQSSFSRSAQNAVTQPSSGASFSMPAENNPGIVWVPMPTPQVQRHGKKIIDEETDTDASPPRKPALLPPPATPSGRRSPSKTYRSQSPTKYRRSPTKEY